jgi:hypothetical protein
MIITSFHLIIHPNVYLIFYFQFLNLTDTDTLHYNLEANNKIIRKYYFSVLYSMILVKMISFEFKKSLDII